LGRAYTLTCGTPLEKDLRLVRNVFESKDIALV